MTDIAVNDKQWDAIDDSEKKRITDALIQNGALSPGDRIVGDPNQPPFDENTKMEPMWNPIKDICKAVCDTTAAGAIAWCTANTAGVALAACVAAAEAARRECKRRC
ncbi:hypothetical protein EZI54_23105 [Marinobacter halodurans]|uniref:Uncharacterized protein n=1 Tax=Marinobacter halodurans TaxID=2528979 RepID=A0ABY1ZF95_9GAMM|nr:hypothetical protein [Marinobacter halodurans]TBW46844.1 hypothetical protein EZI54_23105 [Marinobacter halodurans]